MAKITFIGSGNVATHLARELFNAGFDIVQVYSRTLEAAKELAGQVKADPTNRVSTISSEADIYVVALKDSVVHDVLKGIDFRNKLVLHCSGSLAISVLKPYSKNIGVLYPLQTFSKKRRVNFSGLPLFVEANNKENEERVLRLATKISQNVSVMHSEKRKSLHIAAVIACNFTNHMYALAAEYLNAKEISFDVVKPLIEETAAKVMDMDPKDAQTGPAVRYDKNIIGDHLKELNEYPDIQELYKLISKRIFEFHQEKDR